jgi:lipid-A-disaccharide synthase
MHIFLSVGEPSGDQHGAALMRALRQRHPDVRFSGFGGVQMESAGLESLHRLTNLAVMGIGAVIPLLWTFYKLVRQAGEYIDRELPDAVVLIDFPGFNWWIARKAKKAGVPVYYYMPPQLWAWAPWRIKKVRKYVDHVLAALPFEAEWYASRGVSVEYVGHPFFDEVAAHRVDDGFCKALRAASRLDDRDCVVGLLPGSRNQEVRRNFPVMLQVARLLHERHPKLRFPVACYKESHRAQCAQLIAKHAPDLPIDLRVGRTPEIIDASDCCLMVSGSVSLELLARCTPAVVVYRGTLLFYTLVLLLVKCHYNTLPNLIAGRAVMPEFPFVGLTKLHVRRMADILDGWISEPETQTAARRVLMRLKNRVAQTGGVERAAEAISKRLWARAGESTVIEAPVRAAA